MMQLVMQPGMVYRYPLWGVALLLTGLSAVAAVSLELLVRRFVSVEFRRRHNDAAAAIFSIIGVTFAVLLAFVAMLAWEGFNKAKAASHAEAGLVLEVYNVSLGFPEPQRGALRDDIVGYLEAVTLAEWPAQAEGRDIDRGSAYLDQLNRVATAPPPAAGDRPGLQEMLAQSLYRLWEARQQRLLAAETTIPAVVWIVTILGGGLTIAFASFLGVPNLAMHLAMSAVLAVSGTLVLILIIALSNPFRGDFRVSTRPFDQVLARIEAASARP
jgi:Protein of unknown function (DUF4239)